HGTDRYVEAAVLFRELVLAGDVRVPDAPHLRARDHDRPATTRIADEPIIDDAQIERPLEHELTRFGECVGKQRCGRPLVRYGGAVSRAEPRRQLPSSWRSPPTSA